MKLLKNTLISTLIISSVAMAQGDNFSRSSAALADLKSKAEMTETKSDSDKLFYLVDDFSQLKTVPGFTFGHHLDWFQAGEWDSQHFLVFTKTVTQTELLHLVLDSEIPSNQ